MLKRSREKFIASNGGKPATRKGFPDGVKGPVEKRKYAEAKESARQEVIKIMEKLAEDGQIDKEALGNQVIIETAAIAITRDVEGKHYHGVRDRVAAANTVLPYLVEKKQQKQAITVQTVDDFLKEINEAE